MASFPYSSIPPEFEQDGLTAAFMEDLRKLAMALQIMGNGVIIRAGSGTPQGTTTANRGSLYLRTDGGAGTTLYVKESGLNTNTGWVGK
jgi:hypothetical protein